MSNEILEVIRGKKTVGELNKEDYAECILLGTKRGAGLAKAYWTDEDCVNYFASKHSFANSEGYFFIVIATWKPEETAHPFWYLNEILKNCAHINAFYVNWLAVNVFLEGCVDIYLKISNLEKCLLKKEYKYLHQEVKALLKKREGPNNASKGENLTLSKIGKKGAANSNARHNLPREAAKNFAQNYWKEHPDATKLDVAEKIQVHFIEKKICNNGDQYSIDTIQDWIKKEMPANKRTGGRPKKPKSV